MIKGTPQEKLRSAESEIDYLSGLIRYHDAEASRIRKMRETQKARKERALKAIEREAKAAAYQLKSKV